MLDCLKHFLVYFGLFLACVWQPLNASNRPIVHVIENDPTTICLHKAEELKECKNITEMVRIIYEMRNYLINKGCEIPPLRLFLDDCRRYAREYGIEISDAEFEALRAEFEAYELDDGIQYKTIKHKHHHKKHKKDKEIKINSKTAVGFIKFFAGSLLCLVPVPMVQSAGIALAVIGASEMADGAREQSDKKEWEERLDANRRSDFTLQNP